MPIERLRESFERCYDPFLVCLLRDDFLMCQPSALLNGLKFLRRGNARI